jgi:hypothetical protein
MSTKKDTRKPKGAKTTRRKSAKDYAELDTFAEHFAVVLTLARESDAIPSSFHNDLTEAWNEFLNRLPSLDRLHSSPAFVKLALQNYVQQTRERGA